MKSIRRARGSVLVAVLCLSPACGMAPKAEAPSSGGEAAPAAAAPTSAESPTTLRTEEEPRTLADAEALLERARADLDRLALNEPGAPAAGVAPPEEAARRSPAPSKSETRRADKSATEDDAARLEAKETNPCETTCRAFSSLTRASDAVCRLDSEGGKRCERARQIREDASRRVAGCGCG